MARYKPHEPSHFGPCIVCQIKFFPGHKGVKFWIENTTRRFKDGYNYFGRHPEKVITFFNKHMQ